MPRTLAGMSSSPAPRPPVDPTRVIATLALAFSIEPWLRWLFPQTDRFHAGFPDLVHVSAGAAFDAGTADVVYDGAAAALWVSPGAQANDEAWAAFFQRHVDATRLEEVLAWGQAVGEHHPSEPHWYLAMIGVDPHWQGQGFGSQLLRHGLARCDRDGLPAYLETTLPRNRVLFERHGFTALTELRVADTPPVWPMLRAARG